MSQKRRCCPPPPEPKSVVAGGIYWERIRPMSLVMGTSPPLSESPELGLIGPRPGSPSKVVRSGPQELLFPRPLSPSSILHSSLPSLPFSLSSSLSFSLPSSFFSSSSSHPRYPFTPFLSTPSSFSVRAARRLPKAPRPPWVSMTGSSRALVFASTARLAVVETHPDVRRFASVHRARASSSSLGSLRTRQKCLSWEASIRGRLKELSPNDARDELDGRNWGKKSLRKTEEKGVWHHRDSRSWEGCHSWHGAEGVIVASIPEELVLPNVNGGRQVLHHSNPRLPWHYEKVAAFGIL